jgi:hypothetical protein
MRRVKVDFGDVVSLGRPVDFIIVFGVEFLATSSTI